MWFRIGRLIKSTGFCGAHEACDLGTQRTWTVDRVRSVAEEFLRRFTVEAYYEEFREVTSHWNRSLLPKMERSFRNSPQWHQFEAELLAVAERQAGLEAGTPGNDAGSRRAADTVMAPAPALTTQATGQITTPRTVKDELVELLDRIVYEQGTTLEKWAHFHKIGRTTLLDWKALRLAGKPLKGKVSAEKNAEIETAIREDARTLEL